METFQKESTKIMGKVSKRKPYPSSSDFDALARNKMIPPIFSSTLKSFF